jgi:chromosome partitioning protein
VLSYISLVAATHILVPIETQYKAFCGTELLLNTVSRIRARANRKLTISGFIPTRYDSRNSQDERTLHAIQEQLTPVATVYPPISRSTGFADASEQNLPLAKYNPKHPGVTVLNQIAQSLEALA